MSTWTVRKKVVDARTSAASGTTVVDTITELVGHDLDAFSELIVYLDVNTALVGSTPTMDIYLQRALVEEPNPTNDDHWNDLYAFPQITTSLVESVIVLPITPISTSAGQSNASSVRAAATLAAATAMNGHWGDRLRIVEKMGGTVTTQAVYDITITGQLRVLN